ncbi:MAG: DNA gyrase inhibitor YacG [Deltaproteobacteria bacterium]|nr:MAG: DNA gyrase inhibitor YacG [Deltaproteobacteria bacterium]
MWRRDPRAARLGSVRRVRCPTCRREVDWEGNPCRPFCSERCRILDLAAWADERYRIPGEPVPAEPTAPDDDSPKNDGR